MEPGGVFGAVLFRYLAGTLARKSAMQSGVRTPLRIEWALVRAHAVAAFAGLLRYDHTQGILYAWLGNAFLPDADPSPADAHAHPRRPSRCRRGVVLRGPFSKEARERDHNTVPTYAAGVLSNAVHKEGSHAYNAGAGMNSVEKMAAFVQHNMPQNKPGTLSAQEACDVAAYVKSKPHQRFNPAFASY